MESTPTPKGGTLAKAILVTTLALGSVLGVTVAYADDPTPTPSAAPTGPTGAPGGTGTSADCPGM